MLWTVLLLGCSNETKDSAVSGVELWIHPLPGEGVHWQWTILCRHTPKLGNVCID